MPATNTAVETLSLTARTWLLRATPCTSGADRLELVGVRSGTSVVSMGLTGLVKKADGFRFILTPAGVSARSALLG